MIAVIHDTESVWSALGTTAIWVVAFYFMARQPKPKMSRNRRHHYINRRF